MLFEENYCLKKVPPYLFRKITALLDKNESWKKIQKCEKIYDIIKPPLTLSPLKSPGEHILDTLITILCTMGNLREILLHSELYDALSTFYTEKLKIQKQPTEDIESSELIMKRKNSFKLEFSVWGIPEPKYQWYKDEELLPDQTDSILSYESYTANMEGEYYCIATQIIEDYRTSATKIEKIESDFVTVLTQQERCIITKLPPTEISCKIGDPTIVLEVIADGFPVPRYQWTHNNKLLDSKKNIIKIPTIIDWTGIYRCRIFNGINDLMTTTTVKIIDPNYKFPVCLEPVIEKVAILIGNENYAHQEKLSTPMNDTKALQKKLETIGFLVLNVNNLNYNGMIHAIKYFQKMCCEGCIAVFYYAGHGFEFGEKYLMPIDVPDSKNFRMKNSICEYMILKEILATKPKLFLCLLDMCLTFPNRYKECPIYVCHYWDKSNKKIKYFDENPGIFEERKEIFHFEANRNLLRGYSTTTGYSSVEMQKMQHSTYNCILQDQITKKIPILQMLRAINSEFDDLAKSSGKVKIAKQMPSISENLSKDYYLNVDKIGNPPSKEILDMLQRSQARTKPNITETK